MPQFKFRLATLLRLREATRDERRSQLAQAYRAEEIVRAEAERIEGELGDLEQLGRSACRPGHIDVDRLLEVRRYEAILQAQKQQAQKQQRMIEDEIERRRQAVAEANREVRVLEQLREKQYQRHCQEEHRQEIKQLDEVGQRRAGKEVRP